MVVMEKNYQIQKSPLLILRAVGIVVSLILMIMDEINERREILWSQRQQQQQRRQQQQQQQTNHDNNPNLHPPRFPKSRFLFGDLPLLLVSLCPDLKQNEEDDDLLNLYFWSKC